MEIIARSSLRYGRVLSSFTFGSIQTRLFGATLLPKSEPMSISRFFGARFPFPPMQPKSHHGCRIFISIQWHCVNSIQSSNGGATLILVLERLAAGVTQSRLRPGRKLICGTSGRRDSLVGVKWEH